MKTGGERPMEYSELLENPALVHLLDARDIMSALRDAQRLREQLEMAREALKQLRDWAEDRHTWNYADKALAQHADANSPVVDRLRWEGHECGSEDWLRHLSAAEISKPSPDTSSRHRVFRGC